MPDLETCNLRDPAVQRWIGSTGAAVAAAGSRAVDSDAMAWNTAASFLSVNRRLNAQQMQAILFRRLAEVEAKLPSVQAAFLVKPGDAFTAFQAIKDVLAAARREIFFVDPFMEDRVLRTFGPAIADGVAIRLLTNTKRVNDILVPAADAWMQTHGSSRPLQVRRASGRELHDRFVSIDSKDVWLLSQSLNGFATSSPATVVRFDDDLAADKIEAYEAVWATASVVL